MNSFCLERSQLLAPCPLLASGPTLVRLANGANVLMMERSQTRSRDVTIQRDGRSGHRRHPAPPHS